MNSFLLYKKKKKRILSNEEHTNELIRFIQLEQKNFFEKIKIVIFYENNRWPLEIGKFSTNDDLLYYLKENYNFTYDKINYRILFFFNGKRFYSLTKFNIINGDIIEMRMLPSFIKINKELEDDIDHKYFQIFIRDSDGGYDVFLVKGTLSFLHLKLLIEEEFGYPYEEIRLIKNLIIRDERTLFDYDIREADTFHIAMRQYGG